MRRFAALYARLDASRATQDKLAALRDYFAAAPPADAAWALWFLSGERLKRIVPPTRLRQCIAARCALPAAVVDEAYAHVGDLAETLALLFDTAGHAPDAAADWPLSEVVAALQGMRELDETAQCAQLCAYWARLPRDQLYLFNKLLTGALRVGVSAGLVVRALAAHAGLEPALLQHRLMGDWQPGAEAYARLLSAQTDEIADAQPYPFCLAAPLESAPAALGAPNDFVAEWKWDGIRAQLLRRGGRCYLWSRGEEALGGRFPEIETAATALPEGCVLDGEILPWRESVLPFAQLQTRIARKRLSARLLQDTPVIFLAYDLLECDGRDLREQALVRRRATLETLIAAAAQPALRLSARIDADDWATLADLREQARGRGVEGLMLKRLDAPYAAGRRRGIWWKWKIAPMTLDVVLVYAQAGHGRRANLYTDYTLAVRDGDALVPVAKAYSGLTDDELKQMDRWIRAHTREKFGPVRSVEPQQVFEIAFEGIQASPRHKAGIALRFPRIHRWRRDKPAAEADTLDTVRALLAAHGAGSMR
jgi:DNA ligase 1